MATRHVFSDEELQQLRGFPEAGRAELIRYFTLARPDEMFVRKFRGKPNVMGAAVQLCTLPWLGFVPDEVASAPAEAVTRLAERLDIRARLLAEYGVREQTRTDHLREIAGYLGWRSADEMEWKQLQEVLFSRAMEHDSPRLLFRLACEYLMSVRVIRPGVVNILERVATARDRALAETWTRVEHLVQGERRRAELDGLLVVDPYLGRTPLAWLGTGPTQATPAAVKGELEKLAYLRRLDAHTLDLSVLPAERRRFLGGGGCPVDGAGVAAPRSGAPVSDLADVDRAVRGRRAGRGVAAVRPGVVGAGGGGPGEDERGPRGAREGWGEPAGPA